ncbi:hypothetical protein N7462_008137 [Penicillium macrosclerotiorum]|uniref:uncharacterized protein n=1 Tax=Penicillium macrosclerotiorum TaxID=303699 RepID=UPI0025476DC2|nr:uncharacterized protein N7462_008137 [Penicillium macrosclerotiorum]KAJ5679893.1 hypothetical protein N7462_008137 [Penicillium macrosclerotiorum]
MSRQHQQDELAYPHFALIYLDRDGNLHHEASRSIANSRESILSPRVTDAFLRAVAQSSEALPSHSQYEHGAPAPGATSSPPSQRAPGRQIPLRPQLNRVPHGAAIQGIEGHPRAPVAPRPALQPAVWPAAQASQQEQWSRWSGPNTQPPQQPQPQPRPKHRNEELSMRSSQQTLISIRDQDFLRRYYEKVFQNLQQTNCRVLAKAYVKLVEPRKQVNYPYNGRKIVAGQTQQLDPDETKPPWWPLGVSHREPDHLPKAERIRLLVHLLCALHDSHGITARRLKEADQPIRRQISPVERLQILDEVYHVREEEEKFLAGATDGTVNVPISRANLPDAIEVAVSQGGRSSRKSTPTERAPSHEPETIVETIVIRSGPAHDSKTSQSSLMPDDKIPPSLSPTNPRHPSRPSSHSPSQYIHQDLPIHPNYDPTASSSSSMSQQDLKRKRQCVETGPATTASPDTLGYYPPMFVGSQPFMPESYDELQTFPHTTIPTTGQPATDPYGEHMDTYAFPYYFDN